jgi:peptide chain release factor 1
MAIAIPWQILQKKHDDLMSILLDPHLEQAKRHKAQKELSHLTFLLKKHHEQESLRSNMILAKEQAAQAADPEMKELFDEEAADLAQKYATSERDLERFVVPPDDNQDRSVFLEIRAGTGGQEAALFSGDLLKMYSNYALSKGWKVKVESESSTDLGGFREVILHIQGKGVFGHLRHESGVHRVQRVPTTETSGRVHTSTATIAVLPEAEDVDVSINPADLRIDVYRSSGAGGQHVNTTDSAVRITHIPTGLVVSCQDERSQHKNKAKALKILQSRLLAAQMEAHEAEMSKQRKGQVGTGQRAEKVRTYNFPQNRVTDHQVNVTLNKLDMVMQGDLEDIIEPLRAREYDKRKEHFLEQFN